MLDTYLDTLDGHGVTVSDVLDVAGNLLAGDKFRLSALPSLFVFTTFIAKGMLNCLQLMLFCLMMIATTIGTTRDDSRQEVAAP
jgi:hypothetical protein